ncbi:hypothetical protein AT15_04325 [Kosmotoga arenicorallina S304]|uniref:FAD/NAD(P)-binding domain-containing protein n=1 Tax=Kosmotoga arenicorallina S304 TaxID=1453497 RepID=A0A176JXI9_9BACT|nr:NAD(P)/FAD-dependent oxidoreductase [Kosmotoga arenicorallina]OAA28433.1 hypothetical protein AT15_04325 [Kosmotoga arenicorallina S304]
MFVDVAIIGAGPAGIACAIQLKHQGIEFVLLESGKIGGMVINANFVENMPLLPPLSGKEVVKLLIEKLKYYDIEVINTLVTSISKKENIFNIGYSSGSLCSKYVVIATGTKPKRVKSFEVSSKVVYEPLKLFGVSGKGIAIAGSGEAAFDAAMSLSKSNRITLFAKHSTFNISPRLLDMVEKSENIVVMRNNPIEKVYEKEDKLFIKTHFFAGFYDNLLISIGREANRELLSTELLSDKRVYLAGDVRRGKLGQMSIAIGDGIEVAQEIVADLRKNR